MEVLVKTIIEVLAKLEAWVKIQQLEELEVFDSLRLSVVLLVTVHWDSLES